MRGIRASNKLAYKQKVVSLSMQVEHCAGHGNRCLHDNENCVLI